MIKQILTILTLSILFVSCEKTDPAIWNKEIIDTYNQTVGDISDFEDLISSDKIGNPNAIKDILEKGKSITDQLEAAIAAIDQKEMPSGAEKYQAAALDMFQCMKDQISIGLQFTNITDESAEISIDNYADKYDAASRQTAKKVDSFITCQQEFIKAKRIQ